MSSSNPLMNPLGWMSTVALVACTPLGAPSSVSLAPAPAPTAEAKAPEVVAAAPAVAQAQP
ncbi:hypothetical protein ACLESO_28025, partial [Pyxidicoccus sp. 3LG]